MTRITTVRCGGCGTFLSSQTSLRRHVYRCPELLDVPVEERRNYCLSYSPGPRAPRPKRCAHPILRFVGRNVGVICASCAQPWIRHRRLLISGYGASRRLVAIPELRARRRNP